MMLILVSMAPKETMILLGTRCYLVSHRLDRGQLSVIYGLKSQDSERLKRVI